MFKQVEHKCFHVAKDARSLLLNAADDTAIVTFLVGTIRRLLLNMTLRKKDPAISDTRLRRVNIRVYNHFFFGPFLTRVCDNICTAAEITMFALPDLFCVIHARWHCAEYKALFGIFANIPRAFAEAPVIIVLAWTAAHHAFLSWFGALDSSGADLWTWNDTNGT